MKTRKRFALAAVLLALSAGFLLAFDTTDAPVSKTGVAAVIDLPAAEHLQNVGGTDGAGLCVPTSVTLAARWQNLPDMLAFRKFTEGRPGGSYPEKLADDLKIYATRNRVTLPAHVQHTGGDESFLDLLIQTRRMPAVTYAGLDGFYDSGIAHMVNLAHLDDKTGAIIDNNRARAWVWMTRKQVLGRWKGTDDAGNPILVPVRDGVRIRWVAVGGGWAFAWLGPPPPPTAPPAKTDLPVEQAPAPTIRGAGYVWEREWDYAPTGVPLAPRWMLYLDGELVWVLIGDKWHEATGPDEWNPTASDGPDDAPAIPESEPTGGWNQGVQVERLSSAHRYWLNRVECSRAKAFAAVSDPGGLVDDSDKYHLSFVGGDRATILALFAPGGKLEAYSRRLHVQVYTADSWAAKTRLRNPVTLQEPAKIGGRVVGKATDAAGLPAILSDVFDVPEPVKPEPGPVGPPAVPAPAGPARWFQILLAAVLGWIGIKLTEGSLWKT